MPKKKSLSDKSAEMWVKGIFLLIGGFALMFVRLPVLGYTLRPFSWVFVIIGLLLLAIPLLMRFAQEQSAKLATQDKSDNKRTFVSSPPRKSSKQNQVFGRELDGVRREPTLVTEVSSRNRSFEWNTQVFGDIEWRRFEAVCELLFSQAGFTTKTQSHGADGGVDIWLYSANAVGPAAIVQCKHWRNRPVGVKELREFFGVMASHKLTRGTYATSSIFTEDALKFAKGNGINAMDGNRLLAQIAQRTSEQRSALLNVAYEGDYWLPTCASCGVKMVERGKSEKRFWGCSTYPKCRSTLAKTA